MELKVPVLERTRILLMLGTIGGPIPIPMALCTRKVDEAKARVPKPEPG